MSLRDPCKWLRRHARPATKAYEAPLTFHSYQNPAVELQAQPKALKGMADDLVRRATLRGAATGAVLGCGAALIGST